MVIVSVHLHCNLRTKIQMEMGVLPPESSNNLEQLGTAWNTQLHHEQNTPKLTEHPRCARCLVNTSKNKGKKDPSEQRSTRLKVVKRPRQQKTNSKQMMTKRKSSRSNAKEVKAEAARRDDRDGNDYRDKAADNAAVVSGGRSSSRNKKGDAPPKIYRDPPSSSDNSDDSGDDEESDYEEEAEKMTSIVPPKKMMKKKQRPLAVSSSNDNSKVKSSRATNDGIKSTATVNTKKKDTTVKKKNRSAMTKKKHDNNGESSISSIMMEINNTSSQKQQQRLGENIPRLEDSNDDESKKNYHDGWMNEDWRCACAIDYWCEMCHYYSLLLEIKETPCLLLFFAFYIIMNWGGGERGERLSLFAYDYTIIQRQRNLILHKVIVWLNFCSSLRESTPRIFKQIMNEYLEYEAKGPLEGFGVVFFGIWNK